MAKSRMEQRREREQKKRAVRAARLRLLGAVVLLAAVVVGVLSLVKGRFVLLPELKLTVQGATEQEIAAFSSYTDEGAVAKRGRRDLTDQIKTDGSVDTDIPGYYTISYSVSDKKDSCQAQRIVHVVDEKAPTIQLKGEKKMTVSLFSLYEEPGYEASDDCDGDLTKNVKVTEEEKDDVCTLTYTVSDKSGNETKAVRTVEIKDLVAPKLTLNGSDHMYVALHASYTDKGATAKDDADGDVTDAIERSGSVDTNHTGDYTVTYTVSDKAGNKATASRKVTVYVEDSNSANRVYLTFDDGPSSKVTPRILDILKENNIKATFFIVNYSDSAKPILRRMIDEGHTIGIHGYSHDYATIYASEEAFMKNIYRLRDKLQADFGYTATVIRFPGGSSNTVSRDYCRGIMSRLTERVEAEGFAYFDWNVTSGDANGNTVAKSTIYNNTTRGLCKGENNVVLMHDTNYKTTTADALQDIIDYARGNGYTFLPLNKQMRPCHHGVAN